MIKNLIQDSKNDACLFIFRNDSIELLKNEVYKYIQGTSDYLYGDMQEDIYGIDDSGHFALVSYNFNILRNKNERENKKLAELKKEKGLA